MVLDCAMPDRAYVTPLTASARRRSSGLDARTMIAAFAVSRAVVLVAGTAGAVLVARVAGWATVDPARLSERLGDVGNALAGAAVRWDSIGYIDIAQHGYTHAYETILFPLYPLLIAGIGRAVSSYVIAGVLISAVSYSVALLLLWRLTALELGEPAADATVILLMVAPVSLFFTAVYTESLFLALSVGSIYAARADRLALAALLAALASVTRITGILLVVPIGVMSWQRNHGHFDRRLALLTLAPLALFGMLAYLHGAGYGWLAPVRNQHDHRFDGFGPIATLLSAVRAAATGLFSTLTGIQKPFAPWLGGPFSTQFDSVVLLIVLIVSACALTATLRVLPLAYGLYAGLALVACIFSQTRVQPLEGLDRYTLTIFPLWMAAGEWISTWRLLRPIAAICLVLLAFYSFEFATWAFIA